MTTLEQFIIARWMYAIGQPIISNEEYTILLETCKRKYPDSPYCSRSWSSDPCPTELLKSNGLEAAIQPIILSDKTESIESLNYWSRVDDIFKSWEGDGTLSYKHDGWNMQASYYNGELIQVNSRGRSSDSMNADILKEIIPHTITAQGSVRVVMECTIPNRNFQTCMQRYGVKDQRAAVSTILAHPESVGLLECNAFDVHGVQHTNKFELLRSWGFTTPDFVHVHNYNDILIGMETLSEGKESYANPTDGIVFDGGFKYAIRLLAWEEPIYKSFISGYEESYNRYVITPKLLIYPVQRGGATQSRLAITNWQRIMDLDLRIGAPVAFRIASSANADVNFATTKLLHEEYENRWEEYDEMIRHDEAVKMAAQMKALYV